jgi:endonuclease/exonuclease/phosphatase family metal-dependent hydrolase
LVTAIVAAAALSTACAPVLMRLDTAPPCGAAGPRNEALVRWLTPSDAHDRQHLRAWCDAVGPVVIHDAGVPPAGPHRRLTMVVWNMDVGKGNLIDLITDLRATETNSDFVLLLQEAYRADEPPAECSPASGRARAIGIPRPGGSEDIARLARRTGMHVVYAPSMRNGVDCTREPREDRGNAVLSTRPLSQVAIIELPFARQRRVAVAAVVGNGDHAVGVISTHFDTLVGHQRMALAIAQAADLLGWRERLIVAGDFNAALPLDSGVREMHKHFNEVNCGGGGTHSSGRRLDRVFVGAGDTTFACRTGNRRYGSDHNPLVAVLPE